MKSVRTLTFLLLSLLAVVLATGCADAQTLGTTGNELSLAQNISFDADGEVEIVAPIEAMGDGTIVVAGQTVHLTDATEIKGQIDVGTMVKVHIFLAEDGTLMAREIEPVQDDDGDDNANGNENANENANDNGNANDNNGNDNDDNGNANEANENTNSNDNANEAPEGATGEIEIVAFVEALDEGSVTVAGWTLLLTPQSEVKGQLEVGMLVKVHVWVMDDGTLVVREIEPAHDDDDDNANGNENANENANDNGNANDANGNENEMAGGVVGEMEIVAPLEAMGEFSVMVAGHELLLTPQSEVKGQLEVGMLVKVHVWVMDDGSLVVREIEPAHDDDDDDDEDDDNRNDNEAREMEIEAPIDAIGEGTVVVAGQTLVLTPQSEVKGQLEVGAMAKVRVLVMADGTLVVRKIEVKHDDDDDDDDNANMNENNANDNDDDDDNDNEEHANANDNDDDDDDRNDNRGGDDDDDDDDRNGNNGGDHNANNSGPGGGDDNHNDDRGGDHNDNRGGDHNDNRGGDDDHGGNDNDDDDDHGGNNNDDDDDDDDDHGGNNNDDDHGRDDD